MAIKIKPSKKGTFTKAAKEHGKDVQAFASQVLAHKENYSPAMVKKANFAKNAAKWHGMGGKVKKYELGDEVPWLQPQDINSPYSPALMNSELVPMESIEDNLGMQELPNKIQGQSSVGPTMPANTPEEKGKGKASKAGGNFGGISLNTMPLLQAADALVTNFIYNPRVKKEEARMFRNQLTPVMGPSNFAGNNDMAVYKKGGTVDRSFFRDDLSDEEAMYYYANNLPLPKRTTEANTPAIDPAAGSFLPTRELPVTGFSFNPKTVPLPERVGPKKTIKYETLYDTPNREGMKSLSPVFEGPWTQAEVRNSWSDIPASIDNIPVSRGDAWESAWSNFRPGSMADDWTKTFAKGGEVYKTNPMAANVLAEGGESMVLPNGFMYPINGDSHSDPSGGEYMNLPAGTRIFSDRIKAPKEVVSSITNSNSKKPITISKLAKKFDTEVEEDILKNSSDALAIRTAQMMKGLKNSKLDQVFDYQESLKSSNNSQKMAKGGKVLGNVLNKVGNAVGQAGEMIPEMTGLINTLTDFPIFTAKYQPTYLGQPTQMNIDPVLNRNLANVKPLLEGNSGNASVDSARALAALSGLQDADNQAYSQKFNFDMQSRQRVNEINNQIGNQANMYNLQRADDFWNKVTARQAAKEASINNIANSAYQKSKGKQLEQRSVDLINQMNNNYKYNPNTGYTFAYDGEGNLVRVPMGYLPGQAVDSNDGIQTTVTDIMNTPYGKRTTKRKEQ